MRQTPLPDAETDNGDKHTQHLQCRRRRGQLWLMTSTINTGRQQGPPCTASCRNNEMDDFSAQPGAPNAFKLRRPGTTPSRPASGPLSSTFESHSSRAKVVPRSLPSAGDPTHHPDPVIHRQPDRPQAHVEDLLAEPRLAHQWSPDELRVEETMPPEVTSPRSRRSASCFEPPASAPPRRSPDDPRGFSGRPRFAESSAARGR
ncbi:MAG: gamma-glutamyltransferase [Akkermansiaceae bacterium]|nr:gamma-glutamyltransferase [Akkermansiaceae bacterium]